MIFRKKDIHMARESSKGNGSEGMISVIGPGTRLTGEFEAEGSVRIEGTIEGTVRAGKAVVIGKDGVVEGDVFTQDAIIAGTVRGLLVAESRLELQATCRIDGDIRARRIQLQEGAVINGTVQMNQGDSQSGTGTGDGRRDAKASAEKGQSSTGSSTASTSENEVSGGVENKSAE